MYRSIFSWYGHWLEVNGQLHVLATLSPRKEPPESIGLEAQWVPEPVWTIWRSEYSWRYRDSNSDPSIKQKVANGNSYSRNGNIRTPLLSFLSSYWFIPFTIAISCQTCLNNSQRSQTSQSPWKTNFISCTVGGGLFDGFRRFGKLFEVICS
jgi:hypothetical protein